jgi:predicted transcriptional regulator of viral defense system
MKLNDFFARHPVFTLKEVDRFLEERGTGNPLTRKALLAHHKKHGRIVAVRRGLYLSVPPGADPATCPFDPFLVAGKIKDDAILAYHTALAIHGKAHSDRNEFTYLTKRPTARPVVFRGAVFRSVAFPKALAPHSEAFGVERVDRSGVDVRATSLERALVDVLDRPDLGGGWEETWRSLESVEYFDLDRVTEYALLLGNATTIAKTGFFLTQHRERLMVTDAHLDPLRANRPKSPHYFDRTRKAPARLVEEWNLVVPTAVLDRTWEERP